MPKTTLNEFYILIKKSRDLRRIIVKEYFQGNDIVEYAEPLEQLYKTIQAIDKENDKYKLYTDSTNYILADLKYETSELHKDILFCKYGFQEVTKWHESVYNNFKNEVASTSNFIQKANINHFITDRDGTINNYCGRYNSSVQSAYNAIWLTSFVKKHTQSATILTSAPLTSPGITDVNVSPEEYFIFAGSKGREFLFQGKEYQLEITQKQKEALKKLNENIIELTKQDQYNKFTLIGSGLQFKFGQTTIARQDISGAIPAEESLQLLDKIEQITHKIDPDGQMLRIEDTGKDIEIMLTVSDRKKHVKDFDKGDGVNFINKKLKLQFEKSNCLVCGDTHSDISMAKNLISGSNTVFTIFVTQNQKLINDLNKQFDHRKLKIVSNPDVLISALWMVSQQ